MLDKLFLLNGGVEHRGLERWWSRSNFSNWGFRVYKNLNFGEARMQERCKKKLCFVLIDFEEGVFWSFKFVPLSKNHVLVTCSRILLNITAKITLRCKV